jgi:hypothetical protein
MFYALLLNRQDEYGREMVGEQLGNGGRVKKEEEELWEKSRLRE